MLSKIAYLESKFFTLSQSINKYVLCRVTVMELIWQLQNEITTIDEKLLRFNYTSLLSQQDLQQLEQLNQEKAQYLFDQNHLQQKLTEKASMSFIKKYHEKARELEAKLTRQVKTTMLTLSSSVFIARSRAAPRQVN